MRLILYEIYNDVDYAIDYAFKGKYVLNMYEYLRIKKAKKVDVDEFLNSSVTKEINDLLIDLDEYLHGGSDSIHKQLREGYGHIPKPEARKIRKYLAKIIEDCVKYSNDRKPGRRKKAQKK